MHTGHDGRIQDGGTSTAPRGPRKVTIRVRRDSASNWTVANPILEAGEPGYETDTTRLKLGDGVTAWSELRYISSSDDVELHASLTAHINNGYVHPVYDDDVSLSLLYENAKV